MYKQKRTARVLFIVFIIFTALGLASIVLYQFIPFVKDYPFFTLGAAMITCGYAGIAFANLYKLIAFDEQIRSLYIENRYNLSRESLFFNYQLFEKRINKLIKLHKKQGGTIRYRETAERTFKLERFAVLKEYQGHHYGTEAFKFLVNKIEEDYNPCTIYFNAQYHLLDYYKKLGFTEEGETFYEANIKHIKMIKKI